MKFICKLLIIWIGIGAMACSQEMDTRLLQAEGMMNNSPKEALELLRAIDRPQEFSKKEKAYYNLLYTQALDKNTLTIENDSMIRFALDYYKARKNSIELAKSYFYLGCYFVGASLQEQEQAILAFLNAEEVAKSFDDGALLGLIYGRLENEYSVQRDWKNAFKMNDLTICYFKKSKRAKNEYISYSSRGQMYITNSQYDSARYYIDKAVDGFRSIGDTVSCASSLIYKATILLHDKKIPQAKKVALEARNLVKKSPNSQIELGLAMIYEDEGQLDSARMIALQQIEDPAVNAKYRVYFILAGIEQSRGDYPAALRALKTYSHLRDSIYAHHTTHSYRYAQWYNQQQAEAEKRELMSQCHFFMMVCASLGILLVLLYFIMHNYLNRRKREKAEAEQQTMRLEEQIAQLQQMLQKTKSGDLKGVQSFFHLHVEMLKELMEVNSCYQNNEKKRQAEIETIQKKYLLVNDLESFKILVNVLYNGFGDYLERNYENRLLGNEMKICILTCCHFTIKGIAVYLNVSEKTVYNLRSKIVKTISPNSSQSLEQLIGELQHKFAFSLN